MEKQASREKWAIRDMERKGMFAVTAKRHTRLKQKGMNILSKYENRRFLIS